MIVRLMFAAAAAALAFASAPSAFAQATVAVDAGALTPELIALLRFERPDVAFTSSTATSATRVSLKRDRELLSLEVSENGEPRIERTIAVERERLQPALRIAALLVVEAIAPPSVSSAAVSSAAVSEVPALAPEDISLVEAPAPPWLRFELAASGDVWVSARIGLTFAAHYLAGEDWAIGVRVFSSGLLCCGEIESPTLRGREREVAVLADASYRLTTLDPFELAVTGAAGPSFAVFKGIATYPGGMSPEQDHPWAVEGSLRAALSLKTQPVIGGLRFVLEAGARVRLERMIVQLPEEIRTTGSGLDPGIASPFLDLGVAIDLP